MVDGCERVFPQVEEGSTHRHGFARKSQGLKIVAVAVVPGSILARSICALFAARFPCRFRAVNTKLD
jgi:hypothetical protein